MACILPKQALKEERKEYNREYSKRRQRVHTLHFHAGLRSDLRHCQPGQLAHRELHVHRSAGRSRLHLAVRHDWNNDVRGRRGLADFQLRRVVFYFRHKRPDPESLDIGSGDDRRHRRLHLRNRAQRHPSTQAPVDDQCHDRSSCAGVPAGVAKLLLLRGEGGVASHQRLNIVRRLRENPVNNISQPSRMRILPDESKRTKG